MRSYDEKISDNDLGRLDDGILYGPSRERTARAKTERPDSFYTDLDLHKAGVER